MPKVSVIIPVYNVENYLCECIDSILNQTLKDFELICVDDGSTDHSLEILREYEAKDARVKVLQQKNLGAGAARNKGLAIATGEYLSFLDSDDFFELGMLEEAYKRCKKKNADICIYQVMRYNDQTHATRFDRGSWRVQYAPKKETFDYKDMPDHILDAFQNWAWNKLIRHELVCKYDIKFQEIHRTNDLLFVATCMMRAERITLLEKKLVYYREGMKSNCQATNYLHPLDFLTAFYAVKAFLQENNMFIEVEKSFVNKALAGCLYNMSSIKDEKTRELLFNELKRSGFEKLCITGKDRTYFYDDMAYEEYQKIQTMDFIEYERDKKHMISKRKSLQEKYILSGNNDIPKVSIIVPVYNVERYLEQCLESIVRQTLNDIEIICINDGSTDGCFDILKEYAKEDSRIIVVDKENEGYGVGMNIGMDKATGEYIGIVEPDDYVPLNMFEDLYLKAKEYDLDFVKADFYRFSTERNGNMHLTYNHLTGKKEKYNILFNPQLEPESLTYVMNTWSGIYKRSFLIENNIRHHETPGASFQDNGFWIQTFCFATRAMILDKPYYMNRRDNPNSSVNSPEKVYCMNEEYRYIRNVLQQYPDIWERSKYYYSKKKFGNYLFTLNRINDSFKHQYVLDIYKEFKEAEANDEVERSVFRADELKKYELMMEDPESFYLKYYVLDKNTLRMNELEKRLNDLERSKTWKVGKIIMFVPKKAKGYVKRKIREAKNK